MQPDQRRVTCPLCGEPTSHHVSYCQRCNYLLPWAPERNVEIKKTAAQAEPHGLHKKLEDAGFLPKDKLRCRFCEGQIEAATRQCPHCKIWLVETAHKFDEDPWQSDYNPETLRRVDTIQPRGCLAAGPMKLLLFLFLR